MKILWTAMIASVALGYGLACADGVAKPRKVTADESRGAIFNSAAANHIAAPAPMTDVALMSSKDGKFVAGLFKAAAGDIPFDAYPEDEFCYFLSGSVKLTSADGSVVELKAGEAVVIPKGWKGRWTTAGYSKYYVIYK